MTFELIQYLKSVFLLYKNLKVQQCIECKNF